MTGDRVQKASPLGKVRNARSGTMQQPIEEEKKELRRNFDVKERGGPSRQRTSVNKVSSKKASFRYGF